MRASSATQPPSSSGPKLLRRSYTMGKRIFSFEKQTFRGVPIVQLQTTPDGTSHATHGLIHFLVLKSKLSEGFPSCGCRLLLTELAMPTMAKYIVFP